MEEHWTILDYMEAMERIERPSVPYKWNFDDTKEWKEGTYLRTPESYERVIKEIIHRYNLNKPDRRRIQVDRRKFLFYVCVEMAKFTTIKTGKLFEKDHSTILHNVRVFHDLKNQKEFREGIQDLIDLFELGKNLKSTRWKR